MTTNATHDNTRRTLMTGVVASGAMLALPSIVVLLLITYVDPLTTWLPSLLKK